MNISFGKQLDEVILENQNLIYALSKQYDYNLRDDLFQVGVMGMIDAYNHYEPSRNTKFSSYAYPFIAGEMKKFVRENRNIKISRDIIYLCSRIEKAKDIMRQQLRRDPTISELSCFLEIDEKSIIEALEINTHVRSIDEPINDEGKELTLKDIVSNRECYDKLDLMNLRDELAKLSPKEREIFSKRYVEERTQSEVASMMGISQVDVSRTEHKLIINLRRKLQ